MNRQQDWMYLLGLYDFIDEERMSLYINLNRHFKVRAVIIEDLTSKSNNK